MIPVAADHAANVVDRQILPRCIANVLPAGKFLQHEQAQLIASVQKMSRLRIVRGAHDVALEVLAQNFGVATLYPPGHCGAGAGKGLMTVESAELDDLSVQLESMVREARASEAEATLILIDELRLA